MKKIKLFYIIMLAFFIALNSYLYEFKKATSFTLNNSYVQTLNTQQTETIFPITLESKYTNSDEPPEITEANWINHPHITEIRRLYNEIEGYINNNKYTVTINHTTNDLSLPMDITTYKNDREEIQKLIVINGTEDSGYKASYYYDEFNVLRFIFLELGAVNGTAVEYRIYYNQNEEKIWENKKQLKGPGYPFMAVDNYICIPETP